MNSHWMCLFKVQICLYESRMDLEPSTLERYDGPINILKKI